MYFIYTVNMKQQEGESDDVDKDDCDDDVSMKDPNEETRTTDTIKNLNDVITTQTTILKSTTSKNEQFSAKIVELEKQRIAEQAAKKKVEAEKATAIKKHNNLFQKNKEMRDKFQNVLEENKKLKAVMEAAKKAEERKKKNLSKNHATQSAEMVISPNKKLKSNSGVVAVKQVLPALPDEEDEDL